MTTRKQPRRLPLVMAAAWLAAAACGSTQKNTKPAVDENTQRLECEAGDMTSCIDLASTGCTEAWEIDYEDSPPLYLTSSGLARLDRPGMTLFSTNTTEWLACVEACPDGVQKICLPFGMEMELATDSTPDCQQTIRDIHPWNGLPAKAVNLDCPDGTWELTYVPSLDAVQKALIASRAIKPDDLLSKIDGLVVKVSFSGVLMMSVANVSKANCSLFDYPTGYRVIRGRTAFDDLRAMHPELEIKINAALAAMRTGENDPERQARREIMPQLIDLCGKAGYPTDTPEAVDTCANELPTARAALARVTSIMLDRFVKETEPALREKVREDYLAPLCEHFGK